jgi:hypothetical protein
MEPPTEMKLYSYVVQHDNGYGPNPYFGMCTLCGCKFGGRANIVQLAKVGDWVIGTGGADKRKSAGHGKLIYAMRVDEKLTRREYFNHSRFQKKKPVETGTYKQTRGDNEDPRKDEDVKNHFWRESPRLSDRLDKQFVLISRTFYYFGAKAIPVPEEFRCERPQGFKLEKRGPGFRSNFAQEEIRRFVKWLEKQCAPGKHGEPCYQEMPKGSKRCKSSC